MLQSEQAIGKIFDQVDRPVWVVTARSDGMGTSGLLATWVMPSSIDRAMPMVTAALGRGNFTTELISRSGVFGLHLLRPDQTQLAFDFGTRSGRDHDKFAGVQ